MHTTLYGEKAVGDTLLQGVIVDWATEVLDVGTVFGFLGRGGQADLRGGAEILQHLAARRVIGCAAAVALVDDHEVKEAGRELLVDVLLFFSAGPRLIQGTQIIKPVLARSVATKQSSDFACFGVARLRTKKCHWIASLRSQ